jgi:hypothetical protein
MRLTRVLASVVLVSIAACTSDAEPLPPAQQTLVAAVPRLAVVQTTRPPRLDGSLDDPAWAVAKASGPFVETRKGGVAGIRAFAKLLWDAQHLYVGVDVNDALLRASDRKHDAHLWKQDCVELMLDPDGDGKDYFEIQLSPRGVVFDTRYDARRVPKPFGHLDWDSRIRVGVLPRGEIDDRGADAGYAVEAAIPWHAFSLDGKPVRPPAIGDEWRANLYVMDLGATRQQAAAWSALGIGDFHVPSRFGILAFEGPADEMFGTSKTLQRNGDRLPKRERSQTLTPHEAAH